MTDADFEMCGVFRDADSVRGLRWDTRYTALTEPACPSGDKLFLFYGSYHADGRVPGLVIANIDDTNTIASVALVDHNLTLLIAGDPKEMFELFLTHARML